LAQFNIKDNGAGQKTAKQIQPNNQATENDPMKLMWVQEKKGTLNGEVNRLCEKDGGGDED
jgi:hypothetical protein